MPLAGKAPAAPPAAPASAAGDSSDSPTGPAASAAGIGGAGAVLVPDVLSGQEPGARQGVDLFGGGAEAEDQDHWAQATAQPGHEMRLASPQPGSPPPEAAAVDPGTEPSVGSSGSEEPGGQAAAQTEHFDHDDIPEHEDPSHPSWRLHEKHVFILSLAGKPIYSRYGNEDKLATIMGVMQALVSFVEDDKDQLRSLVAGKHRFVFQSQGPILLVMAAVTGESSSQMAMQLNYVYNQLLFVLTYSQLDRIFKQQTNFDLRRLLGGTEKFIDSLLDMFDTNPSFFLGAVRCLPLQSSVREKIGQVLLSARSKDLVFALLVTDNQLVALLRPRKYSLHPADVNLIFNNVTSNASNFQSAELWMPLCLPRFNNTGFLHAHVSYVDEDCTTCLLLITNEKDAFYELKECRTKIVQALSSNGCLTEIAKAAGQQGYHLNAIEIPDLRHFLYKSKSTSQFTAPVLDAPYNLPGEERRLFRRYQYVHHRIHSSARPLKIFYHVGQKETILGWVTFGFELYASFSPLVTKPAAINAVLRLIRWMKREEDGLFILSSLVF